MKFSLCLVAAACVLSAAGSRITCNPDAETNMSPVTVPTGARLDFWSPAFPRTLSHERGLVYANCNATFSTDVGGYVWVTMLNAYLRRVNPIASKHWTQFEDVDTNTGVYTFLSDSNWLNYYIDVDALVPSGNWSGFQAQVVATNDVHGCPNTGAISLSDSSELVAIASSFFALTDAEPQMLPANSCRWSFSAGAGLKFKVVVNKAKFGVGDVLTLQADNQVPVRISKNSDSPVVFYLTGSALTIAYSGSARTANFGFHGLVTAVRDSPVSSTPPPCAPDHYDVHKGYGSDESCISHFVVPANSQSRLLITDFHTEAVGDLLTIQTTSFRTALGMGAELHLDARTPTYALAWESDGSLVQAGFSFDRKDYSCADVNAEFVVPCDGTQVKFDHASFGYCPGQRLSYKFTTAPECASATNSSVYVINYLQLRSEQDDWKEFSGSDLISEGMYFGSFYSSSVRLPVDKPVTLQLVADPTPPPVGQIGDPHSWTGYVIFWPNQGPSF